MTRASIIAFIDGRAAKLRDKAESGEPGWAMARHDARILEQLAADVKAEMDVGEGACPMPPL